MTVLDRLAERVRAEGGLLAGAILPVPEGEPLAQDLAVEAVREGYLLHYGRPRIVSTDDPDLALLAGDRLYALGLEALAAAGDLEAIETLCDVIARCAQAHAEGRPAEAEQVWAEALRRLV